MRRGSPPLLNTLRISSPNFLVLHGASAITSPSSASPSRVPLRQRQHQIPRQHHIAHHPQLLPLPLPPIPQSLQPLQVPVIRPVVPRRVHRLPRQPSPDRPQQLLRMPLQRLRRHPRQPRQPRHILRSALRHRNQARIVEHLEQRAVHLLRHPLPVLAQLLQDRRLLWRQIIRPLHPPAVRLPLPARQRTIAPIRRKSSSASAHSPRSISFGYSRSRSSSR